MSNVDRAETRGAGFLDPKSRIMQDSREILHGKDWTNRVAELIKRATGNYNYARCEYRFPSNKGMQRCVQQGCIPSHIIPRKDITQRDDRLSNLRWHCFAHDRLTEKQNWRRPRWSKDEKA